MLTPPTTNDPALNRFLEEVASTIRDRVRPEEGWSLSDFASAVSEVISDKRDLIDIVTQYDNIEGLSEEVEREIARLESEIQGSMDFLSSINSKSAQFAEVMAWWDQNYTVIFDAQEALSVFQEIQEAVAEHRGLLSQITAAKEAAEQAAAETVTAEEAAKAAAAAAQESETSATDAAARASASETEVNEAREYVSELHAALSPGGEIIEDFEWIANTTIDYATEARDARDEAQGHADRAEVAAAGVDQVVSDAAYALEVAISDLAQEIKDDSDAAEAARDQAVGAASTATTKADEAAASATLADGRATGAEDAATRAAVSESNAAGSATAAQGHADRAATEAGAAAQIAAQEKIAALVGSAPADLDTIYELPAAFTDRGDAIAAIQDALANRVVGNHSSVIASTAPGPGTPTNQITFVVEGA